MSFLTKIFREKNNSILQALIARDPFLALELLTRGSDLEEKDQHGNVALHYAAACGYIDVIKGILKTGIAIDALNDDGRTPLVYAMMFKQPNAARLLWEHQRAKIAASSHIKTQIIELCDIGIDWRLSPDEASSGFFQKSGSHDYNRHPRAIQIGEELNRSGGWSAMSAACKAVSQILGGKAAANLSCIWSGIGDWVD